MKKGKNKPREVWCFDCADKSRGVVKTAAWLIPVRDSYYTLEPDGFTISKKKVGICEDCLNKRDEFYFKSKVEVDSNHPDLLYRPI